MNTTAPMRGWGALLGGLVLLLPSFASVSAAADHVWLDQLTQLVTEHRGVAEQHGSGDAYDVYLEQLYRVRQALGRGDAAETYRMMNRFMEMLESRAAGIPGWSANALFDYCGRVTPPMYHDVSRHLPRT